ncbi:ABC transporter substrate-binding protein [Flavobacterium salilacus subsp. salilacus]|uniref:ABC transporter substrate-binding protein n=1 Tax=Flavobacterium TaxID=237 RepID=UPI0010753FCB|nr:MULTISPECIES: ABC transporter substrate-binding protein [Flavobacterium]KAF2518498.1 ABC transporter substrate-binding protein [Flavobacterium salilacus subsp. salilacus]MBE1615138.1 ABC transporter substrate-binding protein [Flavobacterium sp. SaA2.13]
MKSIRYYISICCFIFLFTSCSKSEKQNRDHLVFRYNENAAVNSLDPAFSRIRPSIWVCNQLFNGLVQLDDELNIQPDIAKNWKISPDGKTYTFTLRDDVYFHKNAVFGADSTRTVVAADFEYSLNRLLDEDIAAPGRWILQNVESFNAVNDSTFQIQLNKTFPAFLGLLTMKYASVVPHEAFEAKGYDFRANPIGTGPFQFKIWEENIKLVLRKNPLYYEKDENGLQLPYLEAVAITFLPDKQSGFLQFVQGRQDFVSGLDPSYKDEILTPTGELQPKYKNKVNMITGAYLNTEYMGFRLDGADDAVKDKRIRRAMNYGFNRSKMIMYLRNGMGTPAIHGMIPTGLGGYGAKGYDYNPAKARELVAEYKKATGDNNPKIQMSTSASYLDIAEYLQREWQKIGLNVEVDVNPPSTLTQSISNGKVSFFKASWIADYPDAENYLSLFYSKNFSPGGPNYTHFKNEEFDKLYEKAFTVINDKERYLLYRQMDAILMEEAPVIPLFYDKAARFTGKNIEGLGINPLNLLTLKRVKKQK